VTSLQVPSLADPKSDCKPSPGHRVEPKKTSPRSPFTHLLGTEIIRPMRDFTLRRISSCEIIVSTRQSEKTLSPCAVVPQPRYPEDDGSVILCPIDPKSR